MLILRGIAGAYPDPAQGGKARDWPRGALDEPPTLEYAQRRGYVGKVLDVAGWTGADSEQVQMALTALRNDETITALYGFSGGADNVKHITDTMDDRERIKLCVILGADYGLSYFDGPWELVYRSNPPRGHMYGPRALLASLPNATDLG